MKYLIVGLGNIGAEYQGTRHNTGFRIADALAEDLKATFSTERYGDVANARIKNKQVVILKPSTYMNLSGNAVRYWMNKENIPVEKNIAQMLGTEAYPRLRFGIGNDFPRGCQIDYVLGQFTLDERQRLPVRVATAVEAIRTYVLAGLQTAMCDFNNK